MPKRLTEAQQAAYQRDGFVAPIDIFTADEVAQIHAELDAAEAAHGEQLQAAGFAYHGTEPMYSGVYVGSSVVLFFRSPSRSSFFHAQGN